MGRRRTICVHAFLAMFSGVWIVIDFRGLPESAGVKRWLERAGDQMFQRARTTRHPGEIGAIIYRDLSLDFKLEQEPWQAPEAIGQTFTSPYPRFDGWWAPTERVHLTRLHIYFDDGMDRTDDELAHIRDEYADYVATLDNPWSLDVADAIRKEYAFVKRKLYWGYIHNAFTAFCAFILLSFFVILSRPIGVAGLRFLRTREGCCRQCGYDMRGNASAGCPECGWGRDSATE